ncbi:uncharacterized protein EDB93DRAFT_1335691 [Suillus bovinus]|uniref:uncharacterized protein n=1 Tax=Suillus bovinus TaxID=48563 RepID=UPI001B882291|nr:uncharacterized protein EDB93DRAFT_1335691 [Suillus bovinus]KAG2155186.1 hypothetical protein EDB93DRAFT_1335691 [Suillus bovinus]
MRPSMSTIIMPISASLPAWHHGSSHIWREGMAANKKTRNDAVRVAVAPVEKFCGFETLVAYPSSVPWSTDPYTKRQLVYEIEEHSTGFGEATLVHAGDVGAEILLRNVHRTLITFKSEADLRLRR